MDTAVIDSDDPKVHAGNVQTMLTEVVDYLRADLGLINEPKAQALFETAAEVLIGLRTAFEHYEMGEEQACSQGTSR